MLEGPIGCIALATVTRGWAHCEIGNLRAVGIP